MYKPYLFIILFFSTICKAENIYDSIYTNKIYSPSIKTLQIAKADFEFGQPILELGSSEQLTLSFDELNADFKQYKYTFIHCNADWSVSDMQPNEYISGLQEDYIQLYKNSFNTIQQYTHYQINFPSNDMNLTKSGNYIIRVFNENAPNSTILTARFYISEQQVSIDASAKRSTIIQDIFSKQEIDFAINLGGYKISNPYRDLKVFIQQNGRTDNIMKTLQPRMVVDSKLLYDYDNGENTIEAGNEYRNFDIKNLRYQTERILKTETDSLKNTHIYLLPDPSKQFKQFSNLRDINGRFSIHAEGNVTESAIEADYVYVHFSLPFKAPEANGNIYIMGGLTYWNFLSEACMQYNYQKFRYECTMYLKQGYYNYHYILLEKGETTGNISRVEGTHSDTENDYLIYVYHRPPGILYDKLIGIKIINTLVN